MIKILVNGATGKMGRLAVQHINAEPELTVVSTPSRNQDLITAIKTSAADVVLDLTSADAVYENTKTIIAAGCVPVIGTSGLTAAQVDELQQFAAQKNIGGIIVPNFSIGAVLMMQFSATASRYFEQLKIVETHHLDKKDKPSGTARRTAELMAAAKNIAFDDIAIESHRQANAIAEQEVIFSTNDETLLIKHNTLDRECFMPGLLLACKKAPSLSQLVVGLEQLL